MKVYQKFKDEELIKQSTGKDDDVFNIHLGMVALFKHFRKHKINNTKNEDFTYADNLFWISSL